MSIRNTLRSWLAKPDRRKREKYAKGHAFEAEGRWVADQRERQRLDEAALREALGRSELPPF